jgi:unsaturated rhamnogalacturonyl hydrolase
MQDQYFKKVQQLCDFWVSSQEPKMKWMWGEALLGFSLSELDRHLNSDKYTPFLTAFCDYYVKNSPRVDYADTAAPALITYAMQKRTGSKEYKHLTDRVLDYIKYEPRLVDDAVNHLGNSLEGKFYPKSIWVDSLMMFSVFPALYGMENNDRELLDFAARQPGIYSSYMQDKDDKLWYHSYWVKRKSHFPTNKIFWGRGNGWVMCSLPMILDYIGKDHSEYENIIKIFNDTANALLKYQRKDGTFETVLNKVNKTYRELSATALIAAGMLHGARCGYLDKKFLQPGLQAFKAVVDSFIINKEGVFMPEISGPTIPLHIFPYLGYKFIPKGNNWSYGIAAIVFAAIEYDKCNLKIT